MKKVANTLVLLGVAQFIVSNLVYDLFKIDNIWFLSNALTLFIWAYAYYLINNGIAAHASLFFSFNMLWEEIFGNPLLTSFAEYLSALIFLIIISFEHFFKKYARITNGNRN